MGLFQRNPHRHSEQAALYTIGHQETALIVGLGNPGKKYDGTRHNIGFTCLDAFAEAHEFPAWVEKKDLKSFMSMQTLGNVRVILAKPTTFMNLSGEAVQAIVRFYKLSTSNVVVVHDELDLPFGQIRTRTGGSAAGHNGLASVMQHLDEGFGRVRVGIRSESKADAADFVLAKFSADERSQLKPLTKEVISILTEYIYRGELIADTRSFLI